MLQRLGNGVYRITEMREQYPEGESDAEGLESEYQATVPLKQVYVLSQDPPLEE